MLPYDLQRHNSTPQRVLLLEILPLSCSPAVVTHFCNGNYSANVKLLKIGSLMTIQVANFRNVCENSQLCSGAR
jgi:hypothetical protein